MNRSRLRTGRRRLAVTAAVCGAVLAAAVTGAWLLVHGSHPAAGGSGRNPRPGSASGGRAPAAHGSPLPARASTGPVLPARLTGLRWTNFYGVRLPVSPSAGPRHWRDGLAWGFADTPVGALLAAVNIGVRTNAQWGPRIFGPTIRQQVTGLGASALLAGCEAGYRHAFRSARVVWGRPLGRAYVSEVAFGWVAYAPAAATVDIVSAGPGRQGVTVRAVTRVEVVWSRGDWRVVAPPGGDWGNSAARVRSLRGYDSFRNFVPGKDS